MIVQRLLGLAEFFIDVPYIRQGGVFIVHRVLFSRKTESACCLAFKAS